MGFAKRSVTGRLNRCGLLGVALALAAMGTAPAARADMTVEAETMRLRPGRVAIEPSASGGRLAVLPRGRATKRIRTGPVRRIIVTARGDRCPRPRGHSRLTLAVDGERVLAASVGSTGWAPYTARVRLRPGWHRIAVRYRRGHRRRLCDRNLRLDRIQLLSAAADPPPPAQPAPAPAPVPAPPPRPKAEFLADFETGDLRQWTEVQSAASPRIRAVSQTDSGAPAREGSYMGRFEVRDECTNVGDGSCSERSELLWGSDRQRILEQGTEDFIGFSTRWEQNFVCPPPDVHSVFLQPKAGSGSPAFSLENRGCEVGLHQSRDYTIAPLARDLWNDFVLYIKWGEGTAGHVTIYHKRADEATYRKVIDRATDTLTSGSAYFKLGYYRAGSVSGTSVLYHDSVRSGKSFEAVSP